MLAWIKLENAESDAAAAIVAGDFRFYGTYGVSHIVPEAGLAGLLPNGCSVRMIKGTSDMIIDGEAVFRAIEYARRYNRAILSSTHCLSKPISRKGMLWSGYTEPDYQNLTFGNGGYDLVFFYCKKGNLGLTITRPLVSFRDRLVEIESGRFSASAWTKSTPLPEAFRRRDLATVGATFSPSDPVFAEFDRTGSIRVAGESFDATTNDERAAVREFVAACRKDQ